MSKFDDYIKHELSKDETELPDSVRKKIDEALMSLPELEQAEDTASDMKIKELEQAEKPEMTREIKPAKPIRLSRYFGRGGKNFTAAAAGLIFMFVFLLPNVSEAYAQAVERIPVIGSIVRVVTIRNYFYQDDTHELKVNVPKIEVVEPEMTEAEKTEVSEDMLSESAFSEINSDTSALTESLVDSFYAEMEALGKTAHGALYVDYEVITDTEKWFTLRLCVSEVKGSSDTYYKFYNVNRRTGKVVKLGDMVEDESFYSTVEEDIKRQMAERMAADDMQSYWIEGDSFGEGFVQIDANHNFYWNAEGDLVIPFDKYEVSPGYMGTPEFTVDRALIEPMLSSDCTYK